MRAVCTIRAWHRLRSEGVMVDGPYPVTLFEARITHLGDTRPARIG